MDKNDKSDKNDHLRTKRHRSNPNLVLVIFIDLLLAGLGLVIFALFHHALPRDLNITGQILPTPSTTALTSVITPDMSEQTEPLITSAIENPSSNPLSDSESINNEAAPHDATPHETTFSETNPIESTLSGAWASKFADKFTSGAIVITPNNYRSETINISINQVQENEVTYYIADIYLRDLQFFKTAFAGGSYARSRTDTVLDMAEENKAVLAISGDYYGIRNTGVVIRNGELFREELFDDVLLINYDGSMQTFTKEQFDIEEVKMMGAWQAWSFGPMLLENGQPMTSFNSNVTRLNPRCAIGYYEPGHYCFVLVDGRQPDYSVGMTMQQLSELFYDIGCRTAYNLDGGQSAMMVFDGKNVNQPYKGGRNVSDIIFIGE